MSYSSRICYGAMSIAILILDVLKMVSALSDAFMSKVSNVAFQALCWVAMGMVVDVIGVSSLSTEELSVSRAVAVVSLSSEQLLLTIVPLSHISWLEVGLNCRCV